MENAKLKRNTAKNLPNSQKLLSIWKIICFLSVCNFTFEFFIFFILAYFYLFDIYIYISTQLCKVLSNVQKVKFII